MAFVESIKMRISDNKETIQLQVIETYQTIETLRHFINLHFSCDKLGYLLTCILNADFEAAANLVSSYEWRIDTDDCLDHPLNANEVYSALLSLGDVFKLYNPGEWGRLRCDFSNTAISTAANIIQIKKYLAFCEKHQLPYHNQFFNFLNFNGFFCEEFLEISPVEEIEATDMMFVENNGERTLLDDLDKLYAMFINDNGPECGGTSNTYIIDGNKPRLSTIAMISLRELSGHGKVIRKCKNCGRYFVPDNRSDTIYCDGNSPQDATRTCKQYGSQKLWYERQRDDKLATLSRNILSAKSMLAKRNPDIPEYARSYDYFRTERKKWKSAVEEGRKTSEEYREWLLLMQSQKVIKEAVSLNDGK